MAKKSTLIEEKTKKQSCVRCSDEVYFKYSDDFFLCKFHNDIHNINEIESKAFQLFVHNELTIEESFKLAKDFVDFSDKNKVDFAKMKEEHEKKFKKKIDE
jgi:hypothetical protein